MLSSVGFAILALFVTSLIVRVLPAFLANRLSGNLAVLLERVLPLAVFLNFAVYIVFTEMKSAPVPAVLAIATVGAMAFLTRAGLMITVAIGSLVYVLVVIATGA